MHKATPAQIRVILLLQLVVTLGMSAVALAFGDVYGKSALAGGLIATLANAWFAKQAFRNPTEKDPKQILSTVYRAEISKVILTLLMFVAAIRLVRQLHIITLVSTYFICTLIPWLSVLVSDGKLNWRAKNVR